MAAISEKVYARIGNGSREQIANPGRESVETGIPLLTVTTFPPNFPFMSLGSYLQRLMRSSSTALVVNHGEYRTKVRPKSIMLGLTQS